MSKDAMQTEKSESNTGKIVGGAIAAAIGGTIGALLLGGYAVLPAAVVVGLLGVALGAVFD
jgi:dolichol kinase